MPASTRLIPNEMVAASLLCERGIMIPENPEAQNNAAKDELGEEQLDKVAGGFVGIDPPSEERIIVITDPIDPNARLFTLPLPQNVHPPA